MKTIKSVKSINIKTTTGIELNLVGETDYRLNDIVVWMSGELKYEGRVKQIKESVWRLDSETGRTGLKVYLDLGGMNRPVIFALDVPTQKKVVAFFAEVKKANSVRIKKVEETYGEMRKIVCEY